MFIRQIGLEQARIKRQGNKCRKAQDASFNECVRLAWWLVSPQKQGYSPTQ
ncbi:hypothetical protein DCAR_0312484 [Daucus carota subsp. sativus]|uniref:Uncharacterized protein n=1 Tax=Daucus carota subsp. sativus TaxID=79200 RepID=A0A166B1R6_DAUCS|nr:hypothetical protein DCAR_0312484 [Daucus carota subsp. sativus]